MGAFAEVFAGQRIRSEAAQARPRCLTVSCGSRTAVETCPHLAAIAGIPGAKRLVRVTADHIFGNCPRYIPKLSLEEPSVYVPREGYKPPDPPWKSMPIVKDIFDKERGHSSG